MRCELCTNKRLEGRSICQSCVEMIERLIKIQTDFPHLTRRIQPVKVILSKKAVRLPDFAVLGSVNKEEVCALKQQAIVMD